MSGLVRLPILRPRFKVRGWALDMALAVAGTLPGGLAAWRLWSDPVWSSHAMVGLACSGIVGGLIAVKAWLGWKKESLFEPARPPEEVVAWARGAWRQICRVAGQEEPADDVLRISVHVVKKQAGRDPALQQLIPYVGGPGGGEGREQSIRAGISGLVVRTRNPATAARLVDDPEAFTEELVTEWGYTREEARGRTTRGAWMAVPVSFSEDGDVEAVIYLDARERGFFEGEEVRAVVLDQARTLVELLKARYRID